MHRDRLALVPAGLLALAVAVIAFALVRSELRDDDEATTTDETATASPFPTAQPSMTPTAAAASTSTPTPNPTPTQTSTRSATSTSTAPASPTQTRTVIPATATATPTPTRSPTATPPPTATPTPPKQPIQLQLTLIDHEPVAVNYRSMFKVSLRNTGAQPVGLSQLTLQAWYSLDQSIGGDDDCAAGGYRMRPEELAPGATITELSAASIGPSPEYWPQCINRTSGYVIVEVHSRYATSYLPGSWTVAYPVERAPDSD